MKFCGALADHHAGEIGVGMGHRRHDRGVADPEIFHAVHAQVLVDYGHGVGRGSHLAGADAVKIAGVSRSGRTCSQSSSGLGENNSPQNLSHRLGGGEPLDELHRRNHRLQCPWDAPSMRGSMTGNSVGIGALQRQAAAIGLLQKMAGEADHVADPGNRGDLAQDNVKIDVLARRIAFVSRASTSSGRALAA